MKGEGRSGGDEALAVASARVGQVLRGKYRLERVLGVGGMATVYLATHRNQKEFAVKVLHAELSAREATRTRFLREGYIANSVKHPGAVAILDDDIAEDGAAFLVMELLVGKSVEQLLESHGQHLSVPATLTITHALLDVLAVAHAHGVVHRDLKPANLFVTLAGELKVLDFGIARLRETMRESVSIHGIMVGTPGFMPPEQALAKHDQIDARTDLWAVGATMFQLLTGELVHDGETAAELIVNAATKPARSLALLAPETPAQVVAVVTRALAFEKSDRWRDAVEMRDALARAHVEVFGTALPAVAPPSEPTLLARAVTADPTGPFPDDRSSARSIAFDLPSVVPSHPSAFDVALSRSNDIELAEPRTKPRVETIAYQPLDRSTERSRRKLGLAWLVVGPVLVAGVLYGWPYVDRLVRQAGAERTRDVPDAGPVTWTDVDVGGLTITFPGAPVLEGTDHVVRRGTATFRVRVDEHGSTPDRVVAQAIEEIRALPNAEGVVVTRDAPATAAGMPGRAASVVMKPSGAEAQLTRLLAVAHAKSGRTYLVSATTPADEERLADRMLQSIRAPAKSSKPR